MSTLSIYNDKNTNSPEQTIENYAEISNILHDAGICFERWPVRDLADNASNEDILATYSAEIEHFCEEECHFSTSDVVCVTPDHPDKDSLRQKFLNEHTHAEDEVRFFVAGQGIFYLHIDSKVYVLLCQAGDLVSVPDGTKHWFDMGPTPRFTCIRLFSNPEGWVADFTGNNISEKLPRFESLVTTNVH
ncbi:MAG: 1,2-dihydroxy-3-keto-5-methylthiopentene dioxygenase [Oleiphilaceae bacterium]|jgi:1,2-dihydroxy-3-keto-5-methylthiopentene dioxygenase